MTVPSMRFFKNVQENEDDGSIQCELCPHRCRIMPGKSGICRVRFNKGGTKSLPFYGYVTAVAEDPIEKKPLYHFNPGSQILSAGFTGCNMHCPFCQNWQISQQTGTGGRPLNISTLVTLARKCGQIAYTYSEPLVHAEFILDCMKEARRAGIKNVLVTNGCINREAAGEILGLTDAANIDLKSFSKETYSKVLGGDLNTVLDFIKTAFSCGVHTEITTLVVPGLNDSSAELHSCADFICSLDTGSGKCTVPWHLTAYHPDWNWEAPATSPRLLTEFAAEAAGELAYVYTGNIHGGNDTVCQNCGRIVIRRRGYDIDTSGLKSESDKRSCAYCGSLVPIR